MSAERIRKSVAVIIGFLLWAVLIPSALRASDHPLSKDDVTLLLIGGASTPKMVALVEQRGIDFRMSPDLETRFRRDGAADEVIQALSKAGQKSAGGAGETATSGADAENPAPPASAATPAEPPSGHAPGSSPATSQPSVEQKIAATLADTANVPHPPASGDLPLAPMFSLRDVDGDALNLSDYKGKVVLLDFWATWCGPCRSEIPGFVDLQNRYREQGFQVIGVSVDASVKPVLRFREQYRMNYPVAMCDGKVRSLYGGLTGIPTTLLIGKDGRIYEKVVGAPADLAGFEYKIQGLLGPPGGGAVGGIASAANAAPAPAGASSGAQNSAPAAASSSPAAATPPAAAKPVDEGGAPGSLERKISDTLAAADKVTEDSPPPTRSSATSKSGGPPDLSDPNPDRVQQIIQQFTAKEKQFKQARDNYTYHQINKVETLDADGNVDGVYQQEWDILYDDSGKRIERVTYAPTSTLERIMVTEQDLDAMRNIQPFVLTSDDLQQYEVKYLGHVKVDEITAFVFSIRPKEIRKGRQYFQGVVWVDDRDLQIVKTEGKNVPELRDKKNGENMFPRFTTYREQIDGKFWFPTYTFADDKLYFSQGPVHIKEVIRYTDYKQFKSKVRILGATPTDQPDTPPAPAPNQPNQNPPKQR